MLHCLLDDAGVSIGLVSLPFQQERLFFRKEIVPIFEGYRKNVRTHLQHRDDAAMADFGALYRPLPYYLFGRFDLALLYLVDDHDFSCRTLRPFHPKAPGGDKRYPENFVYKVLFGPTPRFTAVEEKPKGIISLFAKIGTPPLIGLTQLKVNNSLLLGGGATFLRLIVNFIKEKSQALEADRDTRLIILESYAWHEITLVMLGPSYTRMLKFASQLRDASYSDLVDAANDRAKDDSQRKELREEFRSLNHLAGPELQWSRLNVSRAPLFGNLTTTLGFDFRMFRNRDLLDRVDPSDRVHLASRWYVKPGRIDEFRARVSKRAGLVSGVGRGDVWYPASVTANTGGARLAQVPTREAIRRYLRENSIRGLRKSVLRRFTLAASHPRIARSYRPRKRFSDKLSKLKFQTAELRAVDRAMRRLRVPKVLIHRILNVYANFNDGALDRNLYASFAELRPFLERVATTLVDEAQTPSISHEELCRRIRKWCGNFERAYRNRFHNSERMGEITDFNFEFKGGIQQVVTAFDAAYKSLSAVLGSPGSFVSVGADPGVDSTEYEVRLNYFHVFQPEMFFAVAGKEAANWFAMKHDPAVENVVIGLLRNDPRHNGLRDGYVSERFNRALRSLRLSDELLHQARFWVNARFLRTHLAEVLTYQVCYAGNWELFCHWALGCFLQMCDAYEPDERLDVREAAKFLFRLRMVAGPLPPELFAKAVHAFGDEDMNYTYDCLAEEIEEIRAAILDRSCLGEFFAAARHASEVMVRVALAKPGAPRGLVPDIQAQALSQAERTSREIAAGHVPRFQQDGPFAAFRFCQHVLCGYLLLLKTTWGGKPPRLGRQNGVAIATEESSSLLFDPTGGLFSHEATARRRLFKYRSAVTMSLWDMGLKTKRDQLARRMR